MTDVVFNWALRGIYLAVGLGAGLWILRWLVDAWRNAEERWPLRVAVAMLLLAVVYGVGHARLLLKEDELEEGREAYARFGDPRRTEERRADVRGWILDCSAEPENALAGYRARAGSVERWYSLGAGGANLIGSNQNERDFTVERLFSEHLTKPRSLLELGELHPAGTDLNLTICRAPTAAAWDLLRQAGRPGAVVVQDVETGALVAYAATGGPEDAPFGIKRYAPPGSVFKLALAALWWESGLPDDLTIPCPSRIQVTQRASIGNFGGIGYGTVNGPAGMLTPSCNTAAVWMAMEMRERLGEQAFVDAYRRFGFLPYERDSAPRGTDQSFWATGSSDWAERMSPPPSRIRISEETGRAEWAQLSIGQGPIDVTVIGVSRFIQAIGNGGVMLPPTIEVEELRRRREEGEAVGTRVMSQETARKLQAAMLRVVDEGTARSAGQLIQGLQWDLGGKTGTAQIAGRPDDGWFAGLVFGPDRRPRFTVVVYLQGGGPGGRMPSAIGGQMTRILAEQPPARVRMESVGAGEVA